VQGSGIASCAAQGACETGRPPQAVCNGADPGRLGVVLALVAAELARSWTNQRRKRGATLATPISSVPRPTSEERTWKP
jgi:hypothetical protein